MESVENIDDLIAKVLAGEASVEETARLEAWKRVSVENNAYFEETKNLFATIDGFKTEVTVDTNLAWKKLDERISEDGAQIIPLFRRPAILRAAASILLLVALGFIISRFFTQSQAEPTIFATKTAVEKQLPDGSKVFMNKNAEITYMVNKDNQREVKLKGEAFFEVKHNEEQPFVITVDEIIIKDIGTAFNVKALPGSNVVEVLVESGEVKFYTTESNGVNLVKGEKATYDKISKQFTKTIPDPAFENTLSYKSKEFYFKETALKDVIAQLNEVYGSDIRLSNDEIGNCLLSVTFNNENIDMIVSIIADTLNLEVIRSGGTITLKGETCSQE